MLADVVTPLWRLDYEQQLSTKQQWCGEILNKFYDRKLTQSKQPKIHRIISSPVIEGYRNKDEFSVRTGADGNPKTVGFFIGKPVEGNVCCVPPTHLINVKERHKELSQIYQEFIRNSPLRACHDLHDGGYWRNLIVRSNSQNEVIAAVVVHPGGAMPDVVEKSKESLMHHFLNSGSNLKALYFQTCCQTRCASDVSPFILLYGEPYLYEELDGYKFRISPDSFFQVNPPAASLMYNAVLKMSHLNKKCTLLDLCCGTGAVSILASDYVRGSIGIEIVSQAVNDAVINAKMNSVTNCHFFCGRIEKTISKVFKEVEASPEIVIVLNPGRAGIDRAGIRAIRKIKQASRLIYISCKADSMSSMQNFHDLCNPKFDPSPAYHLTRMQPVDMFPHTNHCELIMLFQR
ncbi:hypothetical protein AAG570_008688 [Ranatra chinensis]|uniref:tRNA (uracil(54)-C(5))-methyltransferase n=1 Tax=Ranatra chinensis TaxID=642074 RepID=A0ABD0YRW9_9HEMI